MSDPARPLPSSLPFGLPPAGSLAERLAWCAHHVGGKRTLAQRSGISESQLYRYMEPDSALPHDRLLAIANAANINPAWLLTGAGEVEAPTRRPRPEFRPALLIQLQEAFWPLMAEYQTEISIPLRSQIITYLYDILRHDEYIRHTETQLNKFNLLQYISILAEMKSEAEINILHRVFELLHYQDFNTSLQEHHQLLTTWCNLLVRGIRGYYNSYAGQVYFDRMGQTLASEGVAELYALMDDIMKLQKQTQLDWLDMGCGNGRHLAHLYTHMPTLRLRGLELSDLGVEYCRRLEKSERLPEGCVQQGDMRLIPYKKESFDVVFARYSLQSLPYLPQQNIGVLECIDEVNRILKPGGFLVAILPGGLEYFDIKNPYQYFSESTIQNTIGARLTILSLKKKDGQRPILQSSIHTNEAGKNLESIYTVIARKI